MKTLGSIFVAMASLASTANAQTPARAAMLAAADSLRHGRVSVHFIGVDTNGGACEVFAAENMMAYSSSFGTHGDIGSDNVFNPSWAAVADNSIIHLNSPQTKQTDGTIRTIVSVGTLKDEETATLNVVEDPQHPYRVDGKIIAPNFLSGTFVYNRFDDRSTCRLIARVFDDHSKYEGIIDGWIQK